MCTRVFLITATITPTLHYINTLSMRGGVHTHAGSAQWAGGRATALDMYDTAARRCLTRCCLGAHGLEVTKAGWTNRGSVERRNRLCKCCKMGIVEDEVHLIFECPMYDTAAQRCLTGFLPGSPWPRSDQGWLDKSRQCRAEK